MPGPTSGLRAQVVGQPLIYFTLDGKYHHVTTMEAYLRLFPGGGTVYHETSIDDDFIGEPLGNDADVLKGDSDPAIFFYNNGKKRHIQNWSFLARAFNGHFRTIPQAVMNSIAAGPAIPDA